MKAGRTGEGVTPSERLLLALGRRSFLRLWTYAGVSRDQNTGGRNKQGKEVCDLLAIFDQDVIVFSDKSCEFQAELPIEIAWGRWFKKAIAASAKQMSGAVRWLKEHPDRLFTDLSCKKKLPVHVPRGPKVRYHRIIVAHGAAEACRKFFKGGNGSLVLDNRLTTSDAHIAHPFTVGIVEEAGGFVHVLDEIAVTAVLRTLDTISDLVAYLEKKERLLTSGRFVLAAGEEELLGAYFYELNDKGEHDFVLPDKVSNVYFEEGHWRKYLESPQRKLQIEANKISYSWDGLIEKFTHHTLEGTHRRSSSEAPADQEVLYRWLARENRVRRRMLARAFLGIVLRTQPGFRAMRLIEPSRNGDPYYIFVVVPPAKTLTEEEYREFREELLKRYCIVVKLRYPQAEHVVGIATETGTDEQRRSEDLIYIDLREWNDELQELAVESQNRLGILTHPTRMAGTEQEFPRTLPTLMGPSGGPEVSRNKRCPCNSGKRYGRCCGKRFFLRGS